MAQEKAEKKEESTANGTEEAAEVAKKLPKNVTLSRIEKHRVEVLRVLIHATIPLAYPPRFYKMIHTQGNDWSWLAHYNNALVGAICCRFEEQNDDRMYIMILGVLEAYRRIGIASSLLRRAIKQAVETPVVKSIALHVMVTNDLAIDFYKKHGFSAIERTPKYYTNLNQDAYLLSHLTS
ncbi:putative N-acetyltransferase san [Diplonema papillatum]|nr:putative N-acetyltransferase san [Diplonema papillatum]